MYSRYGQSGDYLWQVYVKRLYCTGLPELNPTRIAPTSPEINFELPHCHQQIGITATRSEPTIVVWTLYAYDL